ncbi:flagellar basal-body rod protein FlgG [Nitratiruptor sp. YY09-18]|nr:flagellar basal-body rod protein FlgG [Nitratiruptor sp. YY09-18]
MEKLDETTNNLANVNTEGFKKVLIKEMSQRLTENSGDANHLFVFPRFERSLVDLEQGALKETKRALDVALDGKGFLVVANNNAQLLTRSGHLFLTPNGELIDRNGNAVLSTQNKPIILDPQKDLQIAKDGKIYQDGEEVAQLRLVDTSDVEPVGDTYYRAKTALTSANAKIEQGYLEQSNVNPMLEITSLIEAQRRFEIYSNIIKNLDQLTQKTNEIGKA